MRFASADRHRQDFAFFRSWRKHLAFALKKRSWPVRLLLPSEATTGCGSVLAAATATGGVGSIWFSYLFFGCFVFVLFIPFSNHLRLYIRWESLKLQLEMFFLKSRALLLKGEYLAWDVFEFCRYCLLSSNRGGCLSVFFANSHITQSNHAARAPSTHNYQPQPVVAGTTEAAPTTDGVQKDSRNLINHDRKNGNIGYIIHYQTLNRQHKQLQCCFCFGLAANPRNRWEVAGLALQLRQETTLTLKWIAP